MDMKVEEPEVTYPPLVIDPKYEDGLRVGEDVAFHSEGGKEPYTYSIQSGGGDIGPRTGFFTAGEVAGSVIVKVEDSSGLSTTATVNVVALPPYQLDIEGPALVLTSDCQEFSINTIDQYGNNARRSHSRTITLSGEGLGEFYSNDTCSTLLTGNQFSLAAGDTDNPIYYKNNFEQGITLAASTDGLADGNSPFDVINSGVAVKFVIIDPGDCNVGSACSVVVQAQDSSDSLVTSYQDDVELSFNGANSANGFGVVPISNGQGFLLISDNIAETINLKLINPQGSINDITSTASMTFKSVTPSKYVILEPTDVFVGSPATISVQVQDAQNNKINVNSSVTLNLGGVNAAPVSGITPIVLNLVGGEAVVDITNFVAETVNLTLSNPGDAYDTSNAKDIEFLAKGASKVVISDPVPSSETVRSVSDISIYVVALDEYGNIDKNISGSASISLSGSAFGCSVVTLIQGAGSCSIGNEVSETVTLTLSSVTIPARPDLNPTADSHNSIIFTPDDEDKFIIEEPTDLIAGASSIITIKALDQFNNLTNRTCTSAVNLNVDGKASLIGGAGISISGGVGTKIITNNKAEVVNLSLSVNGASSCEIGQDKSSTKNIEFFPNSVSKYVILKSTDTVVGATTVVTVEAQDANGNISSSNDGQNVKLFAGSVSVSGFNSAIANEESFLNGISKFNLTSGTGGVFTLSLNSISGIDTTSTDDLVVSDCPQEGYIMVPSGAFCVSKYSIKSGVVSTKSGAVHANVSKTDAQNACQGIGANYDLIDSSKWQIIARDIEGVSANWEGGVVGNGDINIGNHTTSSGIIAAGDDAEPCFNITGFNDPDLCSFDIWNINKRTHLLSNGATIWDLGGNVRSWVLGTPTGVQLNYISMITDASQKTNFCPAGDYTSKSSGNYGGLGYFDKGQGDSIIRGGVWNSSVNGGIFSTDTNQDSTLTDPLVGYRCVYVP